MRPFDPDSPSGTPPGGGATQISTEGGGTVMSVDVSKSPLQPATPKPLFKAQGWLSPRTEAALWDASPDGQQFVFAVAPPGSAPEPFTVVLSWTAMLRK